MKNKILYTLIILIVVVGLGLFMSSPGEGNVWQKDVPIEKSLDLSLKGLHESMAVMEAENAWLRTQIHAFQTNIDELRVLLERPELVAPQVVPVKGPALEAEPEVDLDQIIGQFQEHHSQKMETRQSIQEDISVLKKNIQRWIEQSNEIYFQEEEKALLDRKKKTARQLAEVRTQYRKFKQKYQKPYQKIQSLEEQQRLWQHRFEGLEKAIADAYQQEQELQQRLDGLVIKNQARLKEVQDQVNQLVKKKDVVQTSIKKAQFKIAQENIDFDRDVQAAEEIQHNLAVIMKENDFLKTEFEALNNSWKGLTKH